MNRKILVIICIAIIVLAVLIAVYIIDIPDGAVPFENEELPYSIPLYSARLVHDGSVQTIELEFIELGYAYRLSVKDKEGKILWQADAATPHPGWNTLFLTRIGNKEYLAEYNPVMYHGICTYRFRVFSLTSDGEEILLDTGEVDFSINPPFGPFVATKDHFRKQDIEPIKEFYKRLNQYLSDSVLLLNTDENVNNLLPEEYRGRVYGTQEEPITGVGAVFYSSVDLSIDEQMDLFIEDYIRDYGVMEE